jgi:hypothetical protein
MCCSTQDAIAPHVRFCGGSGWSDPAALLTKNPILYAAALRCGRAEPPEPREAALWLSADALSSGGLQPEDAMLVTRTLSLAQAGDQVPLDLLAALASDAARFVEDVAAGSAANGSGQLAAAFTRERRPAAIAGAWSPPARASQCRWRLKRRGCSR